MKEQYEITIDTTKSIKCPDDLMRDHFLYLIIAELRNVLLI